MLFYENLAYAIAQIAHNFGAVTVVGGAVFALVWQDAAMQRRLAWIVLAGWLVQVLSGATFGAISYYYYANFPDLHGIAVVALEIKLVCAFLAIILVAWQLFGKPAESARRNIWIILCGLAVLALSSAAILRWFS